MICVDFNFDEIKWEINEVFAQGQTAAARKFMDYVNDCFLYQHVNEPTHNVEGENATRLDLIFSRHGEDIGNLEHHH